MWFYTLTGENIGPVEEAALRELLRSGQLPANTFVWREGMAQWAPASQCGLVAPIADAFSAPSVYSTPPVVTGDTTGGLIPYKNPNALTGYYVGIGALIPCFGLILGPVALVLGCKGLSYAKANPIVKGVVHAWVAIVLGGLSSLVNWGFLLLGLVSAFLS